MATYSVFLPGEFHGQESLVDWATGHSCKELDMTEQLTLLLFFFFTLLAIMANTYLTLDKY